MDTNNLKFADIESNDIDRINSIQNQIKTKDGEEVILLAYKK